MSDSDADEYVYLGTPLQGSDQVALPVNQQTVRDAAGRQRLHGAFTGGYSAGFYNSVGSQAGFNPAKFTSSREKRADPRQQSVSDFLDDDELEEAREKGLQAKAEYDTFAAESAAKTRAHAADQAAARHGLNLFPEEAVRPVVSSIGVQLLQKMGWKQGRGLGFQEASKQMGFDLSAAEPAAQPAKRPKRRGWGPMMGLQVQNTAFVNLKNKKDTFGLGFHPYANSEDLHTAKKRLREEAAQAQRHAVDSRGRRARGAAFAASVLEDSDVYGGELADYADDTDPHAGMHFEVVSSDEDAGGGGGGRRNSPRRLEGSAATVLLKARQGTMGRDSFIEGFEQPCSRLYGALRQLSATPVEAPAVPPPTDRALKQRIDLAAASVARGGNEMLQFLRKTHAGSQEHSFLHDGEGAPYLHYRTVQIQAALTRATTAVLRATVPQLQQGAASGVQEPRAPAEEPKLSVEQRRTLLAEPSLAGSTAPAAHQQPTAPQAPAAAAADARAQLLLQAEMAGVVRKGAALASRFVKAGQAPAEDAAAPTPSAGAPSAGMLPPTRTQSEWIPSPLLCRCWNVPRPKPSEAPAQSGRVTGAELLAVPDSHRAHVYSSALPDFMKPTGVPQPEALPPPPPRPSAAAAPAGFEDISAGTDRLDQAADDLLASIQADMLEEVEKAAPEPEELPFEKSVDVFNAIFNETDSEGEGSGSDEDTEVPADGKVAMSDAHKAEQSPPSGGPQAPRGTAATAVRIDAAAQLRQAQAAAVNSAIAAIDDGQGNMPFREGAGGDAIGGSGGQLGGHITPAVQDPVGNSQDERGKSDQKRSKHKSRDDYRPKKKHKHEHRDMRRGQPDRQLLDSAAALLSGEVLAQNVSTAEIMAVAAQLKKQGKKDRDRDKKHKHKSSKHHKHKY